MMQVHYPMVLSIHIIIIIIFVTVRPSELRIHVVCIIQLCYDY